MNGLKHPASDVIYEADMQDKPVHVGHLRTLCAGPADLADKIRMADDLGVKVKGDLRYDEFQELNKLRGGSRA